MINLYILEIVVLLQAGHNLVLLVIDQEYKLTYQEISIDTLIKFYGFGRGEAFPALVCMIFGFVNQVV